MKVRNKKIILLTMLSLMGVGMLSFSISHLTPKAAEDSIKPVIQLPSTQAMENADREVSGNTVDSKEYLDPTEAPPSALNQNSDDTSKPIYEFETKAYPEINTLIENYYLAKASGDSKLFGVLLSDPSYAPSDDKIKSENSYIEDYGNFLCYIKKSYEKDSYIVYVYHEVKFFNINTPAPYLDKFYVITDTQGTLKIYSPEYKEELAVYYAARDQDTDVQELIEYTNKKINEAIEEDEQLRIYLEQLSHYFSQKENKQAEGDGTR